MDKLTDEQIAEHHAVLRMACDPKSPFYKMVNFEDGLLALPIPQQHQIYNAMSDDLREMVENKV